MQSRYNGEATSGNLLFITKSLFCISIIFLSLCFVDVLFCSTNCDFAKATFSSAHYKIHNESDRIPFYHKAIELCPGYIRPYELLGNYYRKRGDKESAVNWFTKGAELGSNNHKLYYHLADLLLQEEKADDAWKYINKSIELKSNYAKARSLRDRIEKAVDSKGPTIILYEPSAKPGTKVIEKFEHLSIRGTAFDKSGVKWLKINETPISLDEKGNFNNNILLDLKEKEIVILSEDRIGNKTEILFMAKRKAQPKVKKARISYKVDSIKSLFNKSYAVIIGINSYESWPQLEFAVADARSVEKTAIESGFDEIITIFDSDATQRRILSVLYHDIPNKVKENDRVFFYFAGHGQTYETTKGKKQGYIIPVDGGLRDYDKNAISMEQIRSLSNRINARHILYVMDSCYSGLGFSRSAGLVPSMNNYLKKVASMRVVQMITAGGSGEQVQELEGHGLFTAFFLRAINGEADNNKDGFVTGTELGGYLRPAVSDASDNAQTPLFGRFEGEGEFLFPVIITTQ